MRSSVRVLALAFACLGAAASVAHAQAQTQEPDPAETGRYRVGALRFTPSILVSNLGVDNNVFNEADNPKSDRTAAIGPAVDLWLKAGPSRLSGRLSGQYLYFDQYDNQRAWNTAQSGRWELPLLRISPYIKGATANAKDRPGYEIDARARHQDDSVGVGTGINFSAKTQIVVGAERLTSRYDANQYYDSVDLAAALNRRTDLENVNLRIRLTPLTTFVVRTEAAQDRFDTETIRNTDSVRVMPGFELRPQALISGEAFVGIRRFNPLSSLVPDYTGVVASVKTAYTMRATRLGVRVSRDLNYSYEIQQPYYALTDVGLDVTERITSSWDLVGRVGRQWLAYRNLATSSLPERTDHSWQTGGGVGYRVGQFLRLGVDANYYRRDADPTLATHNYDGLRVGASISYGIPQ